MKMSANWEVGRDMKDLNIADSDPVANEVV